MRAGTLTLQIIKEYYLWKLLHQHKHYKAQEELESFSYQVKSNHLTIKDIYNLRKAYSESRFQTMKEPFSYQKAFKIYYDNLSQ